MKENLQILWIEFKDSPIKWLLRIAVILMIGAIVFLFLSARLPGWFKSMAIQYDLPDKEVDYKWLTGSCTLNTGTEKNPDWVLCSRYYGSKDSNNSDPDVDMPDN